MSNELTAKDIDEAIELLRATGGKPTRISWTDESGVRHDIDIGLQTPAPTFCWVQTGWDPKTGEFYRRVS